MKAFRKLSIHQTIVISITAIILISVITSVFLIYGINTNTTNELVNDQANEINKQIVLNYENYTEKVTDMKNQLQKNVASYDTAYDKAELNTMFVNLEELEGSISAITLFDDSGDVVVGTQEVIADRTVVAIKSWFTNAMYDDHIIHFSSPHKQDIFAVAMEEVISTSTVFKYTEGDIQKEGILLIDMDFSELDALSKVTNLGQTGHIIIVDDQDQIVYTSDKSQYSYESDSYYLIKELIFGSANETIDGNSMVANINTISGTRWRIATFQNVNAIDEAMSRALYIGVLLVIITMAITIVVAYFVARDISNPLKKLDDAIIEFQDGNYDVKVEVEGQKEVRIVTKGYNEMIDKIQELMDEVVETQEGKRDAELTVLQNQINPHFLYNTLDCMIWLAEENRNDDLVETVNALSTYFRVSLSKGKELIPISEELRHIESYMLIQRVRYNGAFVFNVQCDKAAEEVKIMKLILQPLVENAIYHGIDKDDEDSFIDIIVSDREEHVVLSVKNSGYGITDEKIAEIYKAVEEGNEKGSVGMKNVYRRIKLFYGDDAKFIIESELDESTTMSIWIPKEKSREEGGRS
jgi:two-component system sensor histidine kinase YesM